MGTLGAIKQSNLARFGTYGLVILWYVIFTFGTLLQYGFTGVTAETPAIRIGVASVAFIVALGLIRWFFEAKGN